jgi:hypothetical protein
MIALSDILQAYGQSYLEKYSASMPYNHKAAIRNILQCRTEKLGGQAYYCDQCKQYRYSYHSCGDRNCNKCQGDKAKEWFSKTSQLLLPVTHFLITFTMPDILRQLTRANQTLFYNILFKAASASLQTLAWDSKYVGGRIAMMAVLHTWTRTLNYHPHLHFIVPGGGLWEDGNLWLQTSEKFIVPACALSKLFRSQMQKLIKNNAPQLYNSIPHNLWNQKWVVHCKAVGTGQKAVKYLSVYVFRPALSNNRILSMDNNFVTFNYIDNKTQFKKTMKLPSEEFIRRYLLHVLPKGFVKVRYFGLFSNTNRKLLAEVKERLPQNNYNYQNNPQTKHAEVKPAEVKSITHRIIICPHCNKPMRIIGTLPKLSYSDKSPPHNKFINLYNTFN